MTSPTSGRPTGPADLREAAYQARLAQREAEEAATKEARAAKRAAKKAGAVATAPKRVVKNRAKIDVQVPAALALVPPIENVVAAIAPAPKGRKPRLRPATKTEAAALAIPIHPTREAWMLAAVEAMRPWYTEAGLAPVPDVSISIGWAGGRGSKKGVRGQCWASHTTSDKRPAVFVTPDQTDPLTIAGIILHEMNHASDDGVSGHKGTFAKNAAALGFVKPWTSSDGKTDELVARLTALVADLGTFPHGAITDRSHGLTGMNPLAPPVQTTRMLKVVCPIDGYLVRTTAKWLLVGLPACPDGHTMEPEAGLGGEDL